MWPSCGLKLASPVLQNWEKLCIVLFWDIAQYSVVETVFFLETLIATYHNTLHHSPLDNDMNAHSCKDLKLCITDQQLNSILKKSSCYQSPQPYTTTSSPPQLLAQRQTKLQPWSSHRQQLQWLHHYYINVVQQLLYNYILTIEKLLTFLCLSVYIFLHFGYGSVWLVSINNFF